MPRSAGETEARLRRHDGAYRRFLISTAPITNASGRVRACGINTDKGGSHGWQRRAAASRCALLRRAAPERDGQLRLGSRRRTSTHWSEELYRIFELDPQTVPTRQLVRKLVHPEDLELYDSVIAHGMADNDIDFEFRIVTPRGA